MTHYLKIKRAYFAPLIAHRKPFEIRKNDRNFKVGDRIELKEYSKISGFTGRSAMFDITNVMTDTEFVKKGFAVLGIKRYCPIL